MDFIFMLTRNDRTVVDCLEVLESIVPLGLKHIGFKDVGVPTKTLKALTTAIKDMGATIPGHGGILDRIDSLIYTSPLFMHMVAYFYKHW